MPSAVQTKTLLQFYRRDIAASPAAKQYLTGLWIPQLPVARDLVNTNNMVSIASRSLYDNSAGLFGLGLSSTGSSTTGAKGLYGGPWLAGTNTISVFTIVTLKSLTQTQECALFRNAGAAGQGVSLGIFPNSKTIRPLLQSVAWDAANDRTDSSIVINTPWFFGMYYSPAEGLWAYSAPVGQSAKRIGAVIYSGSATSPTSTELLYVGGLEYASAPTGTIDGVVSLVGASNRPVPRQWFESLAQNPWQLFGARNQIIYSRISVKPTLSNPAATSITSSSATPQVTLNL
jgi:hypothetical protein